MQIKTNCLIQHKPSGRFLNKVADGLTGDMFSALRFSNESEASDWLLNSMYAPKNTDEYRLLPTETIMRSREDEANEREHEYLRKSSQCS